MKKIILLLFTLPLFIYFITCDRADMRTIAKYGPEPDRIYFFSDGIVDDGAFSVNGDPMSRCREVYETTYSFLEVPRIEPFLSIYEQDARDIVPEVYWHAPVVTVDSSTFAFAEVSTSWAGLWDSLIDSTMYPVTNTAGYYWTGTTPSGTLSDDNCQNWSDNTTGFYAADGNLSLTNSGWIDDTGTSQTCDVNLYLVCVGY